MKPVNIKKQREKEVRHLLERQWEIWDLERELGFIKLERPIRHGWYKEIVITHKIELYKNQKYILEVYDKIEKFVWARTKEKADFQWQHKTSQYLIYNDIPTLSKKQYNRLSDKAKSLCVPFQYYTERRKLRIRFYLKIPKGAYKIKFTRAYNTHQKRIDPCLISEKAFIENQLKRPGYYNINEAFYRWKNHWNFKEYKQIKLKEKRRLNDLKKTPIDDVINDKF
ncbi:hypothetical protein [Psychroserpens sp. Hel_I_66]|uniref:hypothetical protein n=1 Tax=Psychroserpens sp. Hel_I_66 TaxID=1250004 RepID=UPI000648EF61|nr:hypothetical protein [Psychroserpens sp. Hel_I_66]